MPRKDQTHFDKKTFSENSEYVLRFAQKRIDELHDLLRKKASKASQEHLFNTIEKLYASKAFVENAIKAEGFVGKDDLCKLSDNLEKVFENSAKLKSLSDTVENLTFIVDKERLQSSDVITIPTAAVKALNATPYTLLLAPGVNKLYRVEYVQMFKASGTAYTVPANSDLSIQYATSGKEILKLASAGFMDQATDEEAIGYHDQSIGISVNEALVLTVLNAELTDGDSDLKVRLFYRVLNSLNI